MQESAEARLSIAAVPLFETSATFSADTSMPPPLLFDIAGIDLQSVVADQEAIRKFNPQRGDMEHLNGINWFDNEGRILGYKDCRQDEFWVPGHIPGRPLLPGVLMIESAAQLASYYVKAVLRWDGFIGFGGVEECKFRQTVAPGSRLYVLGMQINARHHRFTSKFQGVVDGQLVFEASITGAVIPQ
jgi:3-hydroxyacyl-[acyl-carrier-protein] dehydratase